MTTRRRFCPANAVGDLKATMKAWRAAPGVGFLDMQVDVDEKTEPPDKVAACASNHRCWIAKKRGRAGNHDRTSIARPRKTRRKAAGSKRHPGKAAPLNFAVSSALGEEIARWTISPDGPRDA